MGSPPVPPTSIATLLRRVGSIATAALLIVCMLVVQSREAAMVHVRCAEHGQLLHVRSAGVDHLAAKTTASATRPNPDTPATDHDHCALIGTSHCIELAAPPPITSAVTLAIAPTPPPALVSYAARPTFRIAPKNSPPRAS